MNCMSFEPEAESYDMDQNPMNIMPEISKVVHYRRCFVNKGKLPSDLPIDCELAIMEQHGL